MRKLHGATESRSPPNWSGMQGRATGSSPDRRITSRTGLYHAVREEGVNGHKEVTWTATISFRYYKVTYKHAPCGYFMNFITVQWMPYILVHFTTVKAKN
jgi:hypothetical protein